MSKVLLLGSGELGREVAIEFIRRGHTVVACDRYANAPAMQVSQFNRVFNMNNGDNLKKIIDEEQPDFIVPEIEAIATEKLIEAEASGYNVVPCAKAVNLTMNRKGIREFVRGLGINTSEYFYATSLEELETKMTLSYPVVVKPIQSSSGKGQTTAKDWIELQESFKYALENSRGDSKEVIVEAFVDFDFEITLLTVNAANGITCLEPIRHRQEKGDYQESWQDIWAGISEEFNYNSRELNSVIQNCEKTAQIVVKNLTDLKAGKSNGFGIFGVELFIKGTEVIFSEVSPRPHDTGMVTLISQQLSEFALHTEAVLGNRVLRPEITPGASKAIIAHGNWNCAPKILWTQEETDDRDILLYNFNKPEVIGERRVGVILSAGTTSKDALKTVLEVSGKIEIT